MKKLLSILALVIFLVATISVANAANKVVAENGALRVSADEPLAAFTAAFKFAELGSPVICTKADFSDGIAKDVPNNEVDGVKFIIPDNEKKTILIVVIPFKNDLPQEGLVVNLEFQGGVATLDTTTIHHQSGISLVNRKAEQLDVHWNPIVINTKSSVLPMEFSLSQNYPNPFNPNTTICYALPNNCHVELYIYNVLGQRVKTLVKGEQTAGYKTVTWDGTNDNGRTVSSGIYFFTIKAGSFTKTAKMSMLK